MLKKTTLALGLLLLSVATPGQAMIGTVDCAGDCNGSYNKSPCRFGSVELLYWGNFATTNYAQDAAGLNPETQGGGCDVYYRSKWTPNFRIGIDWPVRCCWDLHADYTWIYSNPSDERFGADDGTVRDQFLASVSKIDYNQGTIGTAAQRYHNIDADITSQINMFQVVARRAFCMNQCVNFRPYAGFGLLIVSNKENYNFVDAAATTRDHIFSKKSYTDGMMVLGFDADWRFCECWHFYGNMKFACLIGHEQYTFDEAMTRSATPELVNASACIDQVGTGNYTSFMIGFAKDLCFCGWYGDLHVAWECTSFKHGVLDEAFNGVTFGANFVF